VLIDIDELVFENEKVFYQGKELDDSEKIMLIIEAIMNEEVEAREQFCQYLISFGNETFKKLWPQLVMGFNNFECVYRYAIINSLTPEELKELTMWVGTNGSAEEIEKFATNVPYIDVDLLESFYQERICKNNEIIKTPKMLNDKQISEYREFLFENASPILTYNFARMFPQVVDAKLDYLLVKSCLMKNDLKYIYHYAKDINDVNLELLEMAALTIYNNMTPEEKFENVKYLHYFNIQIGFSDSQELNDYILASGNEEYINSAKKPKKL